MRINQSIKLKISDFKRMGYLLDKGKASGVLKWSDKSKVSFLIKHSEQEHYLRLSYTITEVHTGVVHDVDYKIRLITKPSNLGKGKVWYFVCPQTFQPCRILYKANNSNLWQSRQAYQGRLNYSNQHQSKYDRYNHRYWELKRLVEELEDSVVKSHYQGKPTRLQQRIERLRAEKLKYDELREEILFSRFSMLL
jgi:hypothetical protein